MEKQKFPKIIIFNTAGGHGHFLTYALDRFCTQTPTIDKLPFNNLGNSHNKIEYSGQFIFYEGHPNELNLSNKNIIFIDIAGQPLYFERANIHRAGDANTDLFSETEIAKFLRKNGSSWPDYCDNKKISLREGYMYGFKNLEQQGSMVWNKQRIEKISSGNNNLFLYNIGNFLNVKSFKESFANVSEHFDIEFDLTGIDNLYKEFYDRNTILQSHENVQKYLSGDKTMQLDILQQAYVDAQKN